MSRQEMSLDLPETNYRATSPFEGPLIIPPLQKRETEAVLKVKRWFNIILANKNCIAVKIF